MDKEPKIRTISDQVAEDLDRLVRESARKQREEAAKAAADAEIVARAQRDKAFIKKHWFKLAGISTAGIAALLLLARSCGGEQGVPEENTPIPQTPSISTSQQVPVSSEVPALPSTAVSVAPPVPEVDKSTTVSIHNAWGVERNDYTCDQLLGSVGLTCNPETQALFNESTKKIENFTARREYDVISTMPWGHKPTDRATVAIVACREFMNDATEQQAGLVINQLWDIPAFNADSLAAASLAKVCPQFK